ncbi:hypothetical protein D3C86_2109220 [compost metagenome]
MFRRLAILLMALMIGAAVPFQPESAFGATNVDEKTTVEEACVIAYRLLTKTAG